MNVGVVAIGRNEGQRLRACLESSLRHCAHVVYVDSGSSDGSVELAKSLGAAVVELDLSTPFTAARARNAGFDRLISLAAQIEFVQFVDGDCEVVSGWIDSGLREMQAKPQAAVVCGRRRERFRDASVYNKICDMEWNTPIGPAKSCGGDALVRTAAFRDVGGYDAKIIAGEEPEMCLRLRQRGWEIWRIDADMTLHDAAMTLFSQFWTRNVRAGHAYAEGFTMHGADPERFCVKEVRSNWFWGAAVPAACGLAISLLALVAARYTWVGLLPLLLYAVPFVRVALRQRSIVYAIAVVVGKVPQMLGQLRYLRSRRRGTRSTIIEYKTPIRASA